MTKTGTSATTITRTSEVQDDEDVGVLRSPTVYDTLYKSSVLNRGVPGIGVFISSTTVITVSGF